MPHQAFVRTLRAQWLGQELRRLREERGMTLQLVSRHLGRDLSALSRYELGTWPIGRADVVALLDLYGFHVAVERDRVLKLAEEVWRTDHWNENYRDIVDVSFIDYQWLESRSERVCVYHTMLIPGLFQLREYAEAVIWAADSHKLTDDEMERGVDIRLERQRLLDDPDGPLVEVIVEESVVRRRIGGDEAAQSQLRYLAKRAANPRVLLRVIPADVSLHGGMLGDFRLFMMPKPYPAVACVEYIDGCIYLESPKSDRYVHAYDELGKAALGPRESVQLIETIAEELS